MFIFWFSWFISTSISFTIIAQAWCIKTFKYSQTPKYLLILLTRSILFLFYFILSLFILISWTRFQVLRDIIYLLVFYFCYTQIYIFSLFHLCISLLYFLSRWFDCAILTWRDRNYSLNFTNDYNSLKKALTSICFRVLNIVHKWVEMFWLIQISFMNYVNHDFKSHANQKKYQDYLS